MSFNKRNFIVALLLVIMCVCLTFVACKPDETPSGEAPYEGPYDIKVAAIGSTTIKAGKTLQLRTSVTGTTNKEVNYKSGDETIATVSDKGIITALKEGTVEIECSLVIEPRCKKSITITVEKAVAPTSITITGTDKTTQWIGESLQLRANVAPSDASELVNWTSTNGNVAAVDGNGLVTFLSEGEVTITATSAEAANVFKSLTFSVKKGVFRSDVGSPLWNVDNQCDDDNPRVSLSIESADAGYHSCYFANVSATRYYVEATFRITKQVSAWDWQGVGFGSGLSEQSTRYFIFSPRTEGQGNDHNKFIVKDLPNESWTAITTRSQTWGENGLDNIDWRNYPVKVALLRDNNRYYYLINDKLMYVDDATIYDEVATMPILVAIDVCAEVTDYSVVTDSDELDQKLASSAYKTSFYASNTDIISYEGNEKFTFRSNKVESKDNKVKSIGDSAKLVGSFEVEFDIAGIECNAEHAMAGVNLNLTRYDNADTVESFFVGTSSNQPNVQGYVAGMYSWDYRKSFSNNEGWISWMETSSSVVTDTTAKHHVKITRTINNNVATFKLFIDGNEINLDEKSTSFVDMTCNYTGAYILWIGAEYSAAQITDLIFSFDIGE